MKRIWTERVMYTENDQVAKVQPSEDLTETIVLNLGELSSKDEFRIYLTKGEAYELAKALTQHANEYLDESP